MTVGALPLTALFIAGLIYVSIKLHGDWQAGRRRMSILGFAAVAGYLIMLAFAGHGLMVAAGL